MFQPLIECLGRFGVSQFNLQVSGTVQRTQVIISPILSAQPANASDDSKTCRVLLTTPVVVAAPLGEIDTRLAEILEQYATEFASALDDKHVSKQLRKAALAAENVKGGDTALAPSKQNKKAQPIKTKLPEVEQEVVDDAVGERNTTGSNAPAAMFDEDVLASLGL